MAPLRKIIIISNNLIAIGDGRIAENKAGIMMIGSK